MVVERGRRLLQMRLLLLVLHLVLLVIFGHLMHPLHLFLALRGQLVNGRLVVILAIVRHLAIALTSD